MTEHRFPTVTFTAPSGVFKPWRFERPTETQVQALVTLGAHPFTLLTDRPQEDQ